MANSIDISTESLAELSGQVVVISGGSSGIGLATVNLLLQKGAKVVIGDLNEPSRECLRHPNASFLKVDVASWTDLCALFKLAKDKHGRIDHVFSNAGISGSADYLDDSIDADGHPVEPNRKTFEVNLIAMVNMAKLGIWYMKNQQGGGSIVLNGSAVCTQRFHIVDYVTSKHGVHGLLRGLYAAIPRECAVRVNALAPAWTETALLPLEFIKETGGFIQSPETVAQSAVLLMGDKSRNGQMLFTAGGKCMEMETELLKANRLIILKALL